jgi:hypothetical protein
MRRPPVGRAGCCCRQKCVGRPGLEAQYVAGVATWLLTLVFGCTCPPLAVGYCSLQKAWSLSIKGQDVAGSGAGSACDRT